MSIIVMIINLQKTFVKFRLNNVKPGSNEFTHVCLETDTKSNHKTYVKNMEQLPPPLRLDRAVVITDSL